MRYISEKTRKEVLERAKQRCKYCLVLEIFLAATFHVEHIRSVKHGGSNNIANLAYACPHCNQNKGSDIATFVNDNSHEITPLFNPRIDVWNEHFEHFEGQIIGISQIGIATLAF